MPSSSERSRRCATARGGAAMTPASGILRAGTRTAACCYRFRSLASPGRSVSWTWVRGRSGSGRQTRGWKEGGPLDAGLGTGLGLGWAGNGVDGGDLGTPSALSVMGRGLENDGGTHLVWPSPPPPQHDPCRHPPPSKTAAASVVVGRHRIVRRRRVVHRHRRG